MVTCILINTYNIISKPTKDKNIWSRENSLNIEMKVKKPDSAVKQHETNGSSKIAGKNKAI